MSLPLGIGGFVSTRIKSTSGLSVAMVPIPENWKPRAYDHIVVCNDISNCLNNCSRITGFLANRSYGCSRMRLDKFQDTVVVILVKGAVIYTG
mgnify:CR=1 FL=1